MVRFDSTTAVGLGPDFPGSSGDRERGKFRRSRTARLTTVAVVADDGTPIAMTTDELLQELLLWQKAMVVGMAKQNEEVFSVADLLDEASEL